MSNYVPTRPETNGINVIRHQNIYGNIYMGKADSGIDMNANVIYEPTIDPRSSLIGVTGREEGQLAYDKALDSIAWWDGARWVYPSEGGSATTIFKVRKPARLVCTNNLHNPITNKPTTIDGVAISDGDRVLFANTTAGLLKYNGLWSRTGSTWTRVTDMNEIDEFHGSILVVTEGDTYHDSIWICTTDEGDVTQVEPPMSNIEWLQLKTINDYNFRKGLKIDLVNKIVDVEIVDDSGLMFVGATPENEKLDVSIKIAGALNKENGLEVRVDGSTVKINAENKLETRYKSKQYQLNFQSGGASLLTFTLPSDYQFAWVQNIQVFNVNDTRFAVNALLETYVEYNAVTRVVKVAGDFDITSTYSLKVSGEIFS